MRRRLFRSTALSILVVLTVTLAACGEVSVNEASDAVGTLSRVAAPGAPSGREYMEAQPCVDVLAEYKAMEPAVGHDAAVMHVSNVYNIKTETRPYVAVSDANARVDQCRGG